MKGQRADKGDSVLDWAKLKANAITEFTESSIAFNVVQDNRSVTVAELEGLIADLNKRLNLLITATPKGRGIQIQNSFIIIV